ncbi:uncharacterized protein B0H64DRAFT_203437 [Chaetomium fimeti]|uniref:Uncharacterized protein n=1 Tax=Chaetomium fimeti TaxID=1854472 RepID=A0AAE0LQ88_9PEZI|nr:hypothetical protein B0H64DRAFT_203437 [Chaetomium fimeti]
MIVTEGTLASCLVVAAAGRLGWLTPPSRRVNFSCPGPGPSCGAAESAQHRRSIHARTSSEPFLGHSSNLLECIPKC